MSLLLLMVSTDISHSVLLSQQTGWSGESKRAPFPCLLPWWAWLEGWDRQSECLHVTSPAKSDYLRRCSKCSYLALEIPEHHFYCSLMVKQVSLSQIQGQKLGSTSPRKERQRPSAIIWASCPGLSKVALGLQAPVEWGLGFIQFWIQNVLVSGT